MKYAVMSDVHANPKALEAALSDAQSAGCGKFILLGDITGYGYDPKGTLKLVRKNFDVVLMGNHDSVCAALEPEWQVAMNYNYDLDRKARDQLTDGERAWLSRLKYLHEEGEFVCTHGDFVRPKAWGYIIYRENALRNALSRTEKLMFCGHTHEAAIWELTAKGVCRRKLGGRFRHPAMKAESISFCLNPARRYIVNVGSVGYPRHDLCSSYGIFDADARRMTIRRLPFDFKSYIAGMMERRIDLPAWLLRILLAARSG